MENLRKLFFELSSEDRLGILQQLSKNAMNVTSLSKKLGLTTQESSRHVSRLSDVGLTQKDSKGLYNLTLYGKLILTQLEGLAFTSKHEDYFASHSLTNLPSEFVSRIGDLAGSRYVDDVSDVFFGIDRVIQDSKEYVRTITDQYLMSTYPLLKEAIERGVQVRNIEARDWIVSPTMKQAYFSEEDHWVAMRQAFNEARADGLIEERMLERLDVFLYMSEKEVAGVAFPLSNGKFDYLGFSSKSERVHKWCSDLFQYYWERARNRKSMVEEIYKWIEKRPKVINVLKNIADGKEIVRGKEQIPELESRFLVKRGKPTVLGDMVLLELQGKPSDTIRKRESK